MNDVKNLFLASFSSLAPILQALNSPKMITIISAIILPIFFFVVGKTVDVCLQIYFRRQEAERQAKLQEQASNSLNSERKKEE